MCEFFSKYYHLHLANFHHFHNQYPNFVNIAQPAHFYFLRAQHNNSGVSVILFPLTSVVIPVKEYLKLPFTSAHKLRRSAHINYCFFSHVVKFVIIVLK